MFSIHPSPFVRCEKHSLKSVFVGNFNGSKIDSLFIQLLIDLGLKTKTTPEIKGWSSYGNRGKGLKKFCIRRVLYDIKPHIQTLLYSCRVYCTSQKYKQIKFSAIRTLSSGYRTNRHLVLLIILLIKMFT